MNGELRQRLADVHHVISDVDGVLTDGGMYYSERGDELKKFSVRDGVGIALFRQMGISFGVLTGEDTALVRRRMEKLKADHIYDGVQNKLEVITRHCREQGCEASQILYLGDEINDAVLLDEVGFFATVADANPYIRRRADLVLETKGGEGALRELAALLLEARGMDYAAAVEGYQRQKDGARRG